MPSPLRIACFVEDEAHEILLRAVLDRLAEEMGLQILPRFPSARGGAPQVQAQFGVYQRLVGSRRDAHGTPDLLILATDCDCRPPADCKDMVAGPIDSSIFPESVTARPASHVEAWYMADPESFHVVVGASPEPAADPCEPDIHKQRLRSAVRAGGHALSSGGLEFGPDLVAAMDLERIRRREPSFDDFVSDLKAALRRIRNYQLS